MPQVMTEVPVEKGEMGTIWVDPEKAETVERAVAGLRVSNLEEVEQAVTVVPEKVRAGPAALAEREVKEATTAVLEDKVALVERAVRPQALEGLEAMAEKAVRAGEWEGLAGMAAVAVLVIGGTASGALPPTVTLPPNSEAVTRRGSGDVRTGAELTILPP
ncbi:MAG TPA: hypothetical protein PKE29_00885, partial [Phycisphaerales bacterium]|nr:hypothetical protein [Phycisphaerales bacterium]